MPRPGKYRKKTWLVSKEFDQKSQAVGAGLARGFSQSYAAKLAGVSLQTVQNWISHAEKGDKHYAEWMKDWREKAEKNTHNLVAMIESAAARDGKWQAAAWLLERLSPEQFAQIRHHQIESNQPVRIEIVEDKGRT